MPSRASAHLLDMKTARPREGASTSRTTSSSIRGETPLKQQQLLTEDEYRSALEKYGTARSSAEMGAEAIRELLQGARPRRRSSSELREDLDEHRVASRRSRTSSSGCKIVESFRESRATSPSG
jgi:DNA-directed RNA polymerase subunit beta'